MAPLDFPKDTRTVISTAKEMAEPSKLHCKGVVRNKRSCINSSTDKCVCNLYELSW